ncbi:MAG: hypothetical protein ACP5UU_05945 [Thermoprotei archaeon]
MPEKGRARIGLIFTTMAPSERTWPYVGYDYSLRVKELSGKVRNAFPDVDFIETVISAGAGENPDPSLIPEDVESYAVFLLGIWNGITAEIVKKRKPTVLIDDLYAGTGEFLSTFSWARNNGYPVVGIASSDFDDALRAISLLKTVHDLKNSTILDIRDEETWSERLGAAKALQELGVQVKFMSSVEVNAIYESVSDEEAMPYYEKWISGALGIREPPTSEVMKAAKLHVALTKAMQKVGADAVTVDCLTLVYGKRIPAYPCLSFAELDNKGSVGTCEADLDSAFTQLAIRYVTSRPSFVSDPVIDTAKNEIVYAHCVAPWKMFGSKGPSNPYVLRSHSEDRSGVSVQSLLPLGEKVTTVKFSLAQKAMAVHSGIAAENVEEEKACRTKLAAKTDAKAILRNWNKDADFAWHRVTFYGDYREDFINLATLLGFKAFEEDKA